jgi:DNA replication and repair protein RecF
MTKKQGIQSVIMQNFRSYPSAALNIDGYSCVFLGDNGSGKTNFLEAISMLSPGRGLRMSDSEDLPHQKEFRSLSDKEDIDINNNVTKKYSWSIFTKLLIDNDIVQIGTGLNDLKARIVKINEKTSRQYDLLERVKIVWFIPGMDRIFTESASTRRKFLNRLMLSLGSGYAQKLSDYEQNMKERMHLLREHNNNPSANIMLKTYEKNMAILNLEIANCRVNFLKNIVNALHGDEHSIQNIKLRSDLLLYCKIDGVNNSIIEISEILKNNRRLDAIAKKTTFGCHRDDMQVFFCDGKLASICSTGQQKEMLMCILIAVVLMNAGSNTNNTGSSHHSIFILDEITAHFDSFRRDKIFLSLSKLMSLGVQIFMSGTDIDSFDFFQDSNDLIKSKNTTKNERGLVRFFEIKDGIISEMKS